MSASSWEFKSPHSHQNKT